MPLEAAVVCLDNSEFSRNGDYIPTRLEAQKDAGFCLTSKIIYVFASFLPQIASLISTVRLESNPENTCGCISMAGNG